MKINLIIRTGHIALSFRRTSQWIPYRQKIAFRPVVHMKQVHPGTKCRICQSSSRWYV